MRGKGREKCPLKLPRLDFTLSCDDMPTAQQQRRAGRPRGHRRRRRRPLRRRPLRRRRHLGLHRPRRRCTPALVLIQRRLELQAGGTGVVVVGLPNVGAGGRGQSRYGERESERQEGPDSEQQPALSWAHLPTCVQFHYRTNAEVCSPTPCRAKPFPSKLSVVAGRAE